jgi:hypothetical protein
MISEQTLDEYLQDMIDEQTERTTETEWDEIRSAIGTTLEAFLIDADDLTPDEPVARERIEAMAKVIALAGNNEFEFRTGTPYRNECRHDNECPTIDWSDWDDHVVPIFLYVNGENFAFVIDVMVHQQGPASFAAVTMMARVQAEALNRAISDPEWRMQNWPRLLFDDAHCWIMR